MSRVIPALLRGGRTDCGRVAVASDERVERVGGGNPRSRSRVEKFIFLLRALSAARMVSVDRLVWSRFNLFNVITRGYKSGARPDRIDCME